MVWALSLTRNLIRCVYSEIQKGQKKDDIVQTIADRSYGCLSSFFRWRLRSAVAKAFKAHEFAQAEDDSFSKELKQISEKIPTVFQRVFAQKSYSTDGYVLYKKWKDALTKLSIEQKLVQDRFESSKDHIADEYALSKDDVDLILQTLFPRVKSLPEKIEKLADIFTSPESLLMKTLGLSSKQVKENLAEVKKNILKDFKSKDLNKIAQILLLKQIRFSDFLALFRSWKEMAPHNRSLIPTAIEEDDQSNPDVLKLSIQHKLVKELSAVSEEGQNNRLMWCKEKTPALYNYLKNVKLPKQKPIFDFNLSDLEIENILKKSEELSEFQGTSFEKFRQGALYLIKNLSSFDDQRKIYSRLFRNDQIKNDEDLKEITDFNENFQLEFPKSDPGFSKAKKLVIFTNALYEYNTQLQNGSHLYPFLFSLLTNTQKRFITEERLYQFLPNAKNFYNKQFRKHIEKPYFLEKSLHKTLIEFIEKPKHTYLSFRVTEQFEKDANRNPPAFFKKPIKNEEPIEDPEEKLQQLHNMAFSIPDEKDRESLFYLLQELATQTSRNFISEILSKSLKQDFKNSVAFMYPHYDFQLAIFERINNEKIRLIYKIQIDKTDCDSREKDSFDVVATIDVDKTDEGWVARYPDWEYTVLNL